MVISKLNLQDKKTLAVKILTRFKKSNPKPKTNLYFKTDFQLLVSVILSAQSTDIAVNKSMKNLYDKGLIPETIIKMGQKRFLLKIKSIGLAPTKAKNIYNLSKIILHRYDAKVPKTRVELEALPGVGRKTASVVLAELFNKKTIAVDTHVFRVTSRLGLHNEKDPSKAEKELLRIIPGRFLPAAHHWFILHGRKTCKSRNPDCLNCNINDLCISATKNKGEKS